MNRFSGMENRQMPHACIIISAKYNSNGDQLVNEQLAIKGLGNGRYGKNITGLTAF